MTGYPERVGRVQEACRPVERFTFFLYVGLLVFVLIFAGAVAVSSGRGSSGVLAFGTALLVVAAASLVGAILGFLFGIPRSLQAAAQAQPADAVAQGHASAANASPAFRTNTSLEEISDWLTKIIIGLGLVQFESLVLFLYKCAALAAAFAASASLPAGDITKVAYDPRFASPVFFCLILAALVSGCLFMYVETRTRLLVVFLAAEFANDANLKDSATVPVSVPQPLTAVQFDQRRQPPVAVAVRATENDKAVAQVQFEMLQSTEDLIGWASAQARLGRLDEAERALGAALIRDQNSTEIRKRIVEVRRLKGDRIGAVRMMMEIAERTTDRKKRDDLLQNALFEALYAPAPDGFTAALEISQTILQDPDPQRQALILVWRACAFGQKYKWLTEHGGSENEISTTKHDARALVEKVVELKPDISSSERALLASLYEGRYGDDDDLKVFKSDEFDKLIFSNRS